MIVLFGKSTIPKGVSNYFELRHQTVPSLEHFSKLQDPLLNCSHWLDPVMRAKSLPPNQDLGCQDHHAAQ